MEARTYSLLDGMAIVPAPPRSHKIKALWEVNERSCASVTLHRCASHFKHMILKIIKCVRAMDSPTRPLAYFSTPIQHKAIFNNTSARAQNNLGFLIINDQ
ncbi:hypothetical protein SAMN05660380_01286 [Xylella fastidiosa]|nr:hypothetical protein SAMN05660380_01286 [Xylella fastidiosa]